MSILERKTYEPLPQGVYRARVVQVSEEHSTKFDQDQWKVEFAIAKRDGSTATLRAWANASFTPKSKLSDWVRALLRRDPGELACLDSDDLVGAECQIVVGVRRRDDGSL